MHSSSYGDLIGHLRDLGPFPDDAAAESALAAVLKVLGRRLMPDERASVARHLPEPCVKMLRQPDVSGEQSLLGLVRGVADVENISAGQAAEHLELVVRAIDQVAGRDVRVKFVRAVPELACLYEPREPVDYAPPSRLPARAPNDLAEGSAGARSSLASGEPAQLAHRHSVARSDDPHGDSKLSGARGLTQERDDDTLASGRPGSRRPLSSGH